MQRINKLQKKKPNQLSKKQERLEFMIHLSGEKQEHMYNDNKSQISGRLQGQRLFNYTVSITTTKVIKIFYILYMQSRSKESR